MRNWGTFRFTGVILLLVSMGGVSLWAQTAADSPPAAPAAAQAIPETGDSASSGGLDIVAELVKPLVLAVVFTSVGLVLFGISIWLIVRLAPFSIRREIEEDQNVALGIIVGAMILGMSIILSAAILG
jgi:hypothetical protein